MENENCCSICAEKYNKSNRLPVTCICENSCCRLCAKQYIESKLEEAHCLFCKNRWNRDFLIRHFEKKYIANDYKTYREDLLFEREIGLLPLTQPYVENEIRYENIRVEIDELEKQRNQINNTISQKYYESYKLKNAEHMEKRKYVRKCPNNTCQGFLSQQLKCEVCSSWVCSDCREIKGTEKNAEHTCNPDILESIKFLSNDTKNCPSCSAMIYRIEGCSQMFCTECHSAFDWNTLRIMNGVIHNPHYFEWRRRVQNGEEPVNEMHNGCQRELTVSSFTRIKTKIAQEYNRNEIMLNETVKENIDTILREIRNTDYDITLRKLNIRLRNLNYSNHTCKYAYTKECINIIQHLDDHENVKKFINNMRFTLYDNRISEISGIVQKTIHIREVELPRWDNINHINNNLDLRILYMRNKISKEDFKVKIQKRNKTVERNIEYTNILRMYVNCMSDLIFRIEENIDVYKSVLDEMHELRKYTNEHMSKILSCYDSSMKHNINHTFEYVIHNGA